MKQSRRSKSTVRKPCDVFKCCPECDSHNLLDFESEVFCMHCDWNSIETHVEARLNAQANRAQEVATVSPLYPSPNVGAMIVA